MKPETPNLDKMVKVADQSQPIGDFLDWLMNDQNVTLMRWTTIPHEKPCTNYKKPHYAAAAREALEDFVTLEAEFRGGDPLDLPPDPTDQHPDTCPCGGTGVITWNEEGWERAVHHGGDVGITRLLAVYFEIDYDRMQKERDAVLNWVRARNGVE